jgi:iturin family lipopeptide synthetase A
LPSAAAGLAATIDTACSSTLASVSLAATLMRARSCRRAVTAAALLTLDPRTIGALAAAGMLAADGRCKTLDAAADG